MSVVGFDLFCLGDVALVGDIDRQSGLWVANEGGVFGDHLRLFRRDGLHLLFLLGLLLRSLLGRSFGRSGRGFSVSFGLLRWNQHE
jgi:hypothetical protein